MIAARLVALAAPYEEMRCTRCGLSRHDYVRGMNPLEDRSCPTFTGMGR